MHNVQAEMRNTAHDNASVPSRMLAIVVILSYRPLVHAN